MAMNAIKHIGEPAVRPLLEALHDDREEVQVMAAGALVHFGELAVGPLIEVLYDNEWEDRWKVVYLLTSGASLQ